MRVMSPFFMEHGVYTIHSVQKSGTFFVFEHNFTTTSSIFVQFSVTVTE